MTRTSRTLAALVAAALVALVHVSAQYQVERLSRGLVAVRASDTSVYVGWRLFGNDPAAIAFNLYRTTGDGRPVKLNATPMVTTTDFVDTTADVTQPNTYVVRPVVNGAEQAPSAPTTVAANAPVQQYLTVPLQRPAGGTVEVPEGAPSGTFTYNANDATVADLDGDGEYEIVLKWDPSNARDTASSGLSGPVMLDAYKLDGTRMWRIVLGRNIRAGAHLSLIHI